MSYYLQTPSTDLNNIIKRRKRISHESEELAWTAARCNRLLRSITQRIGALRKLVDNDFTESAPKPRKSLEKRVANHWSTQDPVWMGDGKRKPGTKTFKARKKVSKQEVSKEVAKDSEIAFPSPFVRRFGLDGRNSEIASPAATFARPALPARLTRQLPIKPGSQRIEAEQGLSSALSSLLGATAGKGPQDSKGTRSLMSTCLRNVPQYIALNEEDESEEDHDFSSEILSYLEDLGTKENGGWSGLREVVRSQAMHALCEAIEDEVLSEKLIRELVDICGFQESAAEGQDLLTAWMKAGDSVTAKQIESLTTFGKQQRCESSSFRVMRQVLDENSASLVGFCKAPRFFNDLLRSLASASSYEAASFLSTCLESCLMRGVDCSQGVGLGIKETMLRLTTMAVSAMLLKNSRLEDTGMASVVHKLASNVIFSGHERKATELYGVMVNCSLLLLGVSHDSHGPLNAFDLSATLSYTAADRRLHSDFAEAMVASVAALGQCLHSDLTSLLLERMVDQASTAPLYKEVALAAITANRQFSQDVENEALYVDYLSRISARSSSTTKTPRTPFRNDRKARFRWEEGICEWVSKTPFTAAADVPPTPSSIVTNLSHSDNKENCVTASEKSCKSITKETCLLQNSPDVLALSPRKRPAAESPLVPRQAKRARAQKSRSAIVAPKKQSRRRTSRLSTRSREGDDSADELGL